MTIIKRVFWILLGIFATIYLSQCVSYDYPETNQTHQPNEIVDINIEVTFPIRYIPNN